MDIKSFAQSNPEVFMQILHLGQFLEYHAVSAKTPEEAFEKELILDAQIAAETAEWEAERKLQEEYNYTPEDYDTPDEVVENPELEAEYAEIEDNRCPHCGSYEGNWQECPECGHGQ